MQQWEYKVIYLSGANFSKQEEILNQQAAQGWRLTAVGAFSSTHTGYVYLYFERPKQ